MFLIPFQTANDLHHGNFCFSAYKLTGAHIRMIECSINRIFSSDTVPISPVDNVKTLILGPYFVGPRWIDIEKINYVSCRKLAYNNF